VGKALVLIGLACAVGAVAFLDLLLKKTRTGRGLRTIAEDPETAVMLGVPVGRLPGDVYVKRGNFSFYFPITTSIILSIILTLILSLFRR